MKHLILLLFTANAHAAEFFVGGGLLTGSQTLTPGASPPAKFTTYGYLVEGGVSFGALDLGAEIGRQDSMNQSNGDSGIENANLVRYGLKTIVHLGRFGVGGGARNNDLTLRSISPNATMLESKYSGVTPFAAINASFNAKRFRTMIELQYATGSLTAKDATLPSTKMDEISIGLHFQLTGD